MSRKNRKARRRDAQADHNNFDQRGGSRRGRKNRNIEKEMSAIAFDQITRQEGPKKKKWSLHDIVQIQPLTEVQREFYQCYLQGDHVVGYGSAGTGKSFLGLFLGLRDVIDKDQPQKKVIIVRSVVPSREMGHLPGTIDEKCEVYEMPYMDICAELFRKKSTYGDMKEAGLIEFLPTSFIRGSTWDDAIIVVDEAQNMTFHELNSVLTRVGQNSRVILLGDVRQTDFTKKHEVSGFAKAIQIAEDMDEFATVEFGRNDIVRSAFVKSWIIAAESFDDSGFQ